MLSAPAALHPKRHGVGSGQAPELLTVGPQAALAELPREALGAAGEDAFRKPFSTAPAIPRVPRRCRLARARREAKLQRRVFVHPPVSLSAVCFSLASGGVALAAAGFTRAALVSAPRGEQAVATRANPALAVGAIEQFAVLTTRRARPARRGHRGTVPRLVAARQKPAQGPTQRQPGLGLRRTRGRAVRTNRRRRSQHRRRSALRATAITPRSRTRSRSWWEKERSKAQAFRAASASTLTPRRGSDVRASDGRKSARRSQMAVSHCSSA